MGKNLHNECNFVRNVSCTIIQLFMHQRIYVMYIVHFIMSFFFIFSSQINSYKQCVLIKLSNFCCYNNIPQFFWHITCKLKFHISSTESYECYINLIKSIKFLISRKEYVKKYALKNMLLVLFLFKITQVRIQIETIIVQTLFIFDQTTNFLNILM